MTHVVRKVEHDLGRAIPPHRDVFGQNLVRRCLAEPACLPEIANLEVAVHIHEEVAGLEVAMQHISRVDVFQTAERLVDERLEVRVRKGLARTNLRKERFVDSSIDLPGSAVKGMADASIYARWHGDQPPWVLRRDTAH